MPFNASWAQNSSRCLDMNRRDLQDWPAAPHVPSQPPFGSLNGHTVVDTYTGPNAQLGDPLERTVDLLCDDEWDDPCVNVSDQRVLSDLNIDQILQAVVRGREETELLAKLLRKSLHDAHAVYFRHEIFRDLQDPTLLNKIERFVVALTQVRQHLGQINQMSYRQQRQGWFLDAAKIYCEAIFELAAGLCSGKLESRGLADFRDFLTLYRDSEAFITLSSDAGRCKDALAQIRYCTRVRGGGVEVTRYDGEPDYSLEVLKVFDRFRQGQAKDYRVTYRTWPGMNHVGARILNLVSRLFPEEFATLDDFCHKHSVFLDERIRKFERQIQFFLTYLDFIRPLRQEGLLFCYPNVSTTSKAVDATETFDLALAAKLVTAGRPVVRNDLHLCGRERVFVVSGPNQGGKTTFARTFGQLHHFASIGCPVPGKSAKLFLFDRMYTHFEREEDLSKMSGKLEEDLIRIRGVLEAATPNSIVIMNEIFASTTLSDARFLGTKVLEKIADLDLLCVYVTFIDELASIGPTVVSMVSTVIPENPVERTFKLIRAPADGLAYALAIAGKYRLTYDLLRERVKS
jgi:DNA mismatch repair protein MutS